MPLTLSPRGRGQGEGVADCMETAEGTFVTATVVEAAVSAAKCIGSAAGDGGHYNASRDGGVGK